MIYRVLVFVQKYSFRNMTLSLSTSTQAYLFFSDQCSGYLASMTDYLTFMKASTKRNWLARR